MTVDTVWQKGNRRNSRRTDAAPAARGPQHEAPAGGPDAELWSPAHRPWRVVLWGARKAEGAETARPACTAGSFAFCSAGELTDGSVVLNVESTS